MAAFGALLLRVLLALLGYLGLRPYIERLPRKFRFTITIVTSVILTALTFLFLPFSPVAQIPRGPSYAFDMRGEIDRFNPRAGASREYADISTKLEGFNYQWRGLPSAVEGQNYKSGGMDARGVAIHNTDSPASAGCNAVYNAFSRANYGASSHFCVDQTGIYQFLSLYDVGFHLGAQGSVWNMSIGLLNEIKAQKAWGNQHFWGIELTLDYSPITEYLENHEAMMANLTVLVKALSEVGGFPLDRQHIITHMDFRSLPFDRVDPECCWRDLKGGSFAPSFDEWVSSLALTPVVLPGCGEE